MKTQKVTIQVFLIILIVCCIFPLSTDAQSKLRQAEGTQIEVAGTSSLHDWEMISSQLKSEAEFEFDDKGNPTGLKSLVCSLEVKTLSSDNRRLDNNAYDALKSSSYSRITYRSGSAIITQNGDNTYKVIAEGRLTIAGVTKPKTIEASCKRGINNTLICSGETQLNMTDYDIKPPTFMLGSMKVGEDVTIRFNLILK